MPRKEKDEPHMMEQGKGDEFVGEVYGAVSGNDVPVTGTFKSMGKAAIKHIAEEHGPAIAEEMVNNGDNAASCCFPGGALVNVIGKGAVAMINLQVGDELEAMTSAGLLMHSRVDFFLHRDPKETAEFLCFSTDDGRELVLTPDHQLGVVDDDHGVLFVFAADVLEDMQLVVPMTDHLQLVRIVLIQRRMCAGLYAPCTREGTIVVAGIGCSCYALVQHEDAHQALAVLRRPLANFPTVANCACHSMVQCSRVPAVRRVALRMFLSCFGSTRGCSTPTVRQFSHSGKSRMSQCGALLQGTSSVPGCIAIAEDVGTAVSTSQR